ncbi:transposable element Tcb2 transposase [Trichonephila clavipes]|uniref:Transposable element Tcb2 transposase n=1 Tax=Trichonephila clavipes TaxID=2585209 RepID=A0A8X7BJ60_TRICX|nr:transposable element Tcb2 transposase [Trichonephila clavipes]
MEAGWSTRQVARQLGLSACVVRRRWDQWIREMPFTRRTGSGRLRQTSRQEDSHIIRNARVHQTASSAAIQAPVAPSLGVPVFSRTIRRHLAEVHLGSRRPLRVLPLTSDDNHVRVWRLRIERLILAFALQRHTAPTVGVMVWDVIPYNTRSALVLIDGIMATQWYVHDILPPHVLPLMQRLPGAFFQQDNAWPHTARASQDCLHTVATLPWPARSPELSSIEHI